MVKALARVFRWLKMLDTGVHTTLEDLAGGKGVAPSYVSARDSRRGTPSPTHRHRSNRL
jgi:hypothetical protein